MRLRRFAGLVVGGGILAALSFKAALAQSTTPNTQIQAIQDQINALQNQLQQLKGQLDQTNQQLKESQAQTKQAQESAQKAQAEVKKASDSDPIVTFPNNRPTIGNKTA